MTNLSKKMVLLKIFLIGLKTNLSLDLRENR